VKVIRYNLELRQPVLIPNPQGEANSAISLPYLPGSVLRGALIERYRGDFDAAEEEARALFLGDTTRFLHAYPVWKQQRALPVSAAWYYDKAESAKGSEARRTIYNFAYTPRTDFQEEAVESNFIWLIGGVGERFSPSRQVNVHTQRNARKGRAVPRPRIANEQESVAGVETPELAGTVYRYDALAAGQTFQALIFTESTDTQMAKLRQMLEGATLYLGRTRRAGYGEVRVTWVSETTEDEREYDGFERPEATEAEGILQVMLTSEALLRDQWGQTTLDPISAIATALGVNQDQLTLLTDSTFLKACVMGGFNRKWGLLLPQTTALAAGSTFSFLTGVPLTVKQIERLERRGIGERCNEGFGQVWVRAETLEQFSSVRAQPDNTPRAEKLTAEDAVLARTIVQRLLRRKMDEELRRLVNHISLINPPPPHQIARWRTLLRTLERGRQPGAVVSLERLGAQLTQINSRRGGEQLARAEVRGDGDAAALPLWIKAQLLPHDEELKEPRNEQIAARARQRWNTCRITLGTEAEAITATVESSLAQEYSLRLVNQVLYRAARLERAKKKELRHG
jgi:CRISPR-associated protein Csx10